MNDTRLDRVFQLDLRSLNYLERATPEAKPRSYTWGLPVVLDQGREGSCVGHGFAHELAAKPVSIEGVTHEYAVNIYQQAQREDEWAGGSYPGASPKYEGTSVLAGAKVLKDRGFYSEYRWGLDAYDIAAALPRGPVVLGVNWHRGMYTPDVTGFIHATGAVTGGHCLLAVGVRIKWKSWINRLVSSTWDNVDMDGSYVILHNSWGPSWGDNGRAKLSLADLNFLMSSWGEACIPTRTQRKAVL